jgi:hypothetical protein
MKKKNRIKKQWYFIPLGMSRSVENHHSTHTLQAVGLQPKARQHSYGMQIGVNFHFLPSDANLTACKNHFINLANLKNLIKIKVQTKKYLIQ